MATRPIIIVVICVGFFLILHSMVPKAMAFKHTNADRYMMEGPQTNNRYTEGQRLHKKKNYMAQRANDQDIGSFDNIVAYEVESLDPDRNPEELSAFIVDYANMIKNDVILLDKSVETRTRKRGNIKVKKINQMIPDDLPCSCNYSVEIKTLGNNVFPQSVETRICSKQTSCRKPFVCKENSYNFVTLNKRPFGSLPSPDEDAFNIHQSLMLHWYVEHIPISVGCTCVPDYVDVETN